MLKRLFSSGWRRSRPEPRRPAVEALEGRTLLRGGTAPLDFLMAPIPESAPLVEHIHPRLKIVIDGQAQVIPADIGIDAAGARPIHTHDDLGYLHIESTREYDFRLKDFFTIWGKVFNRGEILGNRADARHKIAMTVNGRPSAAFEKLLLRDGQNIVIKFTTTPTRPRGR